MNPNVRLADDIAALDRIVDHGRFLLVEWTAHRTGLNENLERGHLVGDDEAGEDRSVSRCAGRDEMDDRRPKFERCPQRPIVTMVGVGAAVGVEDSVGRFAIVVRPVDRRLDRERRRAALGGGTEDPLLAIQERNAPAAKGEASVESADVGNVFAKLRAEHRERVEARASKTLVAHWPILSHRAGDAKRSDQLARRSCSSTRR